MKFLLSFALLGFASAYNLFNGQFHLNGLAFLLRHISRLLLNFPRLRRRIIWLTQFPTFRQGLYVFFAHAPQHVEFLLRFDPTTYAQGTVSTIADFGHQSMIFGDMALVWD